MASDNYNSALDFVITDDTGKTHLIQTMSEEALKIILVHLILSFSR